MGLQIFWASPSFMVFFIGKEQKKKEKKKEGAIRFKKPLLHTTYKTQILVT
jgi:hypothetical protein